MKMRKNVIPNYKNIQVEDGVREETIFIASDGTEFKSKDACKNYEEEKIYKEKLSKIKKKHFNFRVLDELNFPSIWYFVSNEDELETVLKNLGYYWPHQNIMFNHQDNTLTRKVDKKYFELNKWYSHIFEDGGDYNDDNKIYTLDFFREDLDMFLSEFSE